MHLVDETLGDQEVYKYSENGGHRVQQNESLIVSVPHLNH